MDQQINTNGPRGSGTSWLWFIVGGVVVLLAIFLIPMWMGDDVDVAETPAAVEEPATTGTANVEVNTGTDRAEAPESAPAAEADTDTAAPAASGNLPTPDAAPGGGTPATGANQ